MTALPPVLNHDPTMTKATPELKYMLQELIATPSISSTHRELDMSNRAVIDLLADWLVAFGFEVRLLPVPGHSGKFNLLGTLGRGERGLILAGHTDTVPCDTQGWHSDPFVLAEREQRLYGLGTADMKSFLALALEATRDLDTRQFRHPLILLATADEETSMSGARALAADDLRQARYAVIGEPTGLQPVYQHKGMMMERIELQGRSGHSSNPDLGNSALEGMHELMSELLAYRQVLQQQYHASAFEIPVPTLNLGHIHGGDNPNRICGQCSLEIDLRPLPGMSLEDLRSTLYALARKVAQARDLKLTAEPLFPGIDPLQTDPQSPIVQAARALSGHAPGSVAFGTEAPFLNAAGVDTVILGPGDIDQAHQPNEFLEMQRIPPTVKLIRQLIERFCLTP